MVGHEETLAPPGDGAEVRPGSARSRGHSLVHRLTARHRCPDAMSPLIFLDIDGVLNSAQFVAENTDGEGVIIVDGALDATAHVDPARVTRLDRLIHVADGLEDDHVEAAIRALRG